MPDTYQCRKCGETIQVPDPEDVRKVLELFPNRVSGVTVKHKCLRCDADQATKYEARDSEVFS